MDDWTEEDRRAALRGDLEKRALLRRVVKAYADGASIEDVAGRFELWMSEVEDAIAFVERDPTSSVLEEVASAYLGDRPREELVERLSVFDFTDPYQRKSLNTGWHLEYLTDEEYYAVVPRID